MNEYILRPEVAGGLGPQSELDASTYPPRVNRLHYEFSGWLGDDIVESFPTFIVTIPLSDAMSLSRLSGVRFDDLVVTKDPQFEQFFPEVASSLPEWRWLRLAGTPHVDDLWQDETGRLVVSDRALEVFRRFRITNAEVIQL